MKIDNKVISDEMKQQIIADVNGAEDKGTAIYDAAEKIAAAQYGGIADQIIKASANAQADADYKKSLGLRSSFTEKERSFYKMIKDGPKAFQSVTASQDDIIPTELIDRTLADITNETSILSLINFAPAGVTKWLFGSFSGTYSWGAISDAITSEVTAAITDASMDAFKLSAFLVIPKGIRDLEIGYVDKYVRAVLTKVMQDGIANGFLYGNGKTAPIGITKKIAATETDGTHTAKDAVSVKKLSPAGLKAALKVLVHGGKRKIGTVYLICNPLDEVEYVNPALYGDTVSGGFVNKAGVPLTVIANTNVTAGQAVLTIAGTYTMGFSGINIMEYKETKALEDADVMIGKLYANGRADDDDTAVIFDVTKLEEYKFPVVNTVATA